jgi:hypothetical protein
MISIFCMWKSLQISLAVLEAASDFIGSNLRIIFVPVLFFVVQVVTFCCWTFGMICVFSIGQIDNGPAGSQFVVIVACCTWYFNHNSDTKGNAKISTGFAWLFRYHWGSLAFGSFILALIWSVKIILSVIEKESRRSGVGANVVVRCFLCCL